MIKSRGSNIVVMSQFNINGSRGANAGKFVSDYVSRESATDPSMAYVPNPNTVPVDGDGVAFTLDNLATTRKETLDVADHVQDLHKTGKRAIQQLVISFDPDYLKDIGIVPEDVEIKKKGDYRGQYDDIRMRLAVNQGIQALIDREGYRDAKAIACIQRDTRHLHVHAVIYEDAPKIGRMHGKEERGMIKASSLNQLTFDINRGLENSFGGKVIPTEKSLVPDDVEDRPEPIELPEVPEPVYVNHYLDLIRQMKKRRAEQEAAKEREEQDNLVAEKTAQEIADKIAESKEFADITDPDYDADDYLGNKYDKNDYNL